MTLKKPEEYFNRKTKIQETLESTEEPSLSGSFDAFKNIIGKIGVYNKFADTLEEYNQNVEKVNILAADSVNWDSLHHNPLYPVDNPSLCC